MTESKTLGLDSKFPRGQCINLSVREALKMPSKIGALKAFIRYDTWKFTKEATQAIEDAKV